MLPSDPKSELAIDPLLGYPPAFASLCSHPLFSLSPPHSSFLPYPLPPKQLSTCAGLDALFPPITHNGDDEEAMVALRRNHGSYLWNQLNHLGNAGFDPAEFRIDVYGNVLQWTAHSSSPLAWAVDHWFPVSRGGKTVIGNLRLIQWQVCQQKGQKLEFLMPWWDFQLGISVNQFLLIFASKNADFRRRAFLWLFHNDGDSECDGDACNHHHKIKHTWPLHFKRRAEQHGYAAAAIVHLSETENKPHPYCNEYAYDREDGERTVMIQQQKQEELSMMEKELKMIKHRNERESVALGELENTLARHKKQLEKQRQWSEMQSHYRRCLERVIRDTLHQNFIYREQTRLNKAACGALLAKIQSHKLSAEDVELNLVKQLKHREALEVLALQPESELSCHTNVLNDENGLDMGTQNFTYPNTVSDKILGVDTAHENKADDDEKHSIDILVKRSLDVSSMDTSSKPPMDTIMEEEDSIEDAQLGDEPQSISPLKRKVGSDPDARHDYQRQRTEAGRHLVSGFYGRDESLNDVKVSHVKVRREGQQLEEVLQEALTLKSTQLCDGHHGDANGFFVTENDASCSETEEQRVNRLGKSNVEKWLQRLLLNTSASDQTSHDNHDGRRLSDVTIGLRKDRFVDKKKQEDLDSTRNELEKPRKVLDGLFRIVSFRHDHGRKLKTSKESTKTGHDDGVLCNEVREIHCMPEALVDSSKTCNDVFCDVVPNDIDFVKKMKEAEKRKKSCLTSQPRPLHRNDREINEDTEGVRACSTVENPNPTNMMSFSSEAMLDARQDKLKRSFSMRVPTTRSRERSNNTVLHTRRGSDMLTSSWSTSSIIEEGDYNTIESILQPSWSVKEDNEDGNNKKSTNGGLKASLRTCTKAWKHAVSKRRSNKL